tara:strand:+ start:16718 stop:18181 length:1464 start_codon:yes stop_codon:yes gene_type:complete
MISIYPEGTPFPVYHSQEWWSDKWDPEDYAREYDFNRPFFDQWQELMHAVPRRSLDLVNCENSEYCNYCGDDKNCYLDIAGEGNEDCHFNLFTKYSTNCLDCTFVYTSELCYESIQCYNCYACRNSMYLDNCSDCAFCFDLKGCKNCLLSINLRNKEYYILNKEHTKEEYEKKVAELKIDSYSGVQNVTQIWKKMRIENGIYRDMYNLNCEDCSGNNIKNSKNCTNAFNAGDCEDCKYLYDVLEAKTCQDVNYSLYHPEVAYELISTLQLRYSAFSMATHYSNNVFYCDLCENSSNLFGCIGLQHKEYCILNKQYTREEYEELLSKIVEHMKTTGEWGQFFPIDLSPFGYNETVAQEYMPLTKDDVLIHGWNWTDEKEEDAYLGPEAKIADAISDVDDTICDQVLICEASGRPYKIIPQELKFYRGQQIPIPHRSPAQRHLDRNALRNPRKLWERECGKCKKGVSTSYSPERPETVYCEKCYLSEVY